MASKLQVQITLMLKDEDGKRKPKKFKSAEWLDADAMDNALDVMEDLEQSTGDREEMKEALKAGADIIKLFPGSAYGPSIISAFKAPLPQLNIMPTGGVSLANMAEWFDAGVVAVGVGGNLLAPAATGDFAAVTEVAKQYAAQLKEIRGA